MTIRQKRPPPIVMSPGRNNATALANPVTKILVNEITCLIQVWAAYPATGRMERHVVEDVSEGPLWLNDENYSVINYLPWTKTVFRAHSLHDIILFIQVHETKTIWKEEKPEASLGPPPHRVTLR